jgi:solute carrier family 35 protein F5
LINICNYYNSLIGVSLVSYSDHLSGGDTSDDRSDYPTFQSIPAPLIGDFLALLGAIFYGCYTTLLKLRIGSEDRIDMSLFFGFVGAFNVLLLWPVIPILHYIGLETFEIPMNSTLWIVILLNAFIGTFL